MRQHLVIGGTRGIGREVVKRLLATGEAVSVLGRKAPSPGDAEAAGVRYWTGDLATDPAGPLAEILARGPLGSLIFCHRFKGPGEAWDGELRTSLSATKAIIEAAAPHFDPTGPRSIVLTSSIVSHFVADEQPVGYHVAKAGMNQMARYYAVTLGARGIRVNTVSPSVFIKEESAAFYADNPELTARLSGITPLARMGFAGEVAEAILFLAGERASFITGQDLIVDGGISLQAPPSMARKL
ncbi:MAG: SDR family oxidoreductase [Acidobacteria bacterium]|nr:SDR family oxidoreductase [Acidobacteriota bacterium]